MENITLENLECFSVPFEGHPLSHMFIKGQGGVPISDEFRDQLFFLSKEAARFLWEKMAEFKIFSQEFFNGECFKENEKLLLTNTSDQAIKKWLYQRGIPFDQRVFISIQPDTGLVLTWKMVIKFSDMLFVGDQAVWDRTLNWRLVYDHNEVFYYGKNRIYNANTEAEKIYEHHRMVRQLQEQIKENQSRKVIKYLQNPYLKP